jgi:hypothetical protein
MDKAENLRAFFADDANSVTRERIFFNRLSFDLKIAAARAGYHLHLYEPDVDRDGFDIVAEDGDSVFWYQTKAVLSDAKTTEWEISAGFLRPAMYCAEQYRFDPVEAGRGGGVILIEISSKSSEGLVTYRYTDFHILAAIAEGFLNERPYKGPGRPAKPARKAANDVISKLRTAKWKSKIKLTKQLFVMVDTPDHLLGLMGLQCGAVIGKFAIHCAYRTVEVSANGSASAGSPRQQTDRLRTHMKQICDIQPTEDEGAKQPKVSQTTEDAKRKITLFDPLK